MKRRRVLIIAAGICVAAVLVLAVWPRNREPAYQGKRLSQWLEIYGRAPLDGPEWKERSADAVKHIGTNGIPWLIRWMRHEPSKSRIWLNTFAYELRTGGRSGVSYVDRSELLADHALVGFEILRTNASTATPELTERLAACRAGHTSWAVALMLIGKEGLPPLVAALKNSANSNRPVLAICVGRMAYIGTNAQAAVPVLITCMKEGDSDLVSCAAAALGRLRLDADTCLPVLKAGLTNTSPRVRGSCAFALGRFGIHDTVAIQSLCALLQDADFNVRWDVTNALNKIAPELGFKASYSMPEGLPVGFPKDVTNVVNQR